MDSNKDNRVEIKEFKASVPIMQKWGVSIVNPEAEFKKIDTNNGGFILFDEFADYCIKRSLDIYTP